MADTPKQNSAAEELLNLERLVKDYIAKIDKLSKEIKEANQTLKDSFESDAIYHEHAQKAKEANRVKNATKQQLLKQPALMQLAEKVKNLKFDLSEQNAILNDYLMQYQRLGGATQIETKDGQIYEIVSTTKLVKASVNK